MEDMQWQNEGEAGLYYENIQLKKKIENLHIALKKKVEKNKLQASEITLLLKQKEELKESVIINQDLIEQFIKIGTDYEKRFDENNLELNKKDTIIKYLEGRLNEKQHYSRKDKDN